jgi:hypothetical protein
MKKVSHLKKYFFPNKTIVVDGFSSVSIFFFALVPNGGLCHSASVSLSYASSLG